MTIGERIKNKRKELGMTQEQLALKAETTKQTIYKYENEIVTNIPLDRLELLAKGLGVSSAWLMGWKSKKEQPVHNGELSESDKKLLELFHKVPLDKRDALIQMIEAALKMQ